MERTEEKIRELEEWVGSVEGAIIFFLLFFFAEGREVRMAIIEKMRNGQ